MSAADLGTVVCPPASRWGLVPFALGDLPQAPVKLALLEVGDVKELKAVAQPID